MPSGLLNKLLKACFAATTITTETMSALSLQPKGSTSHGPDSAGVEKLVRLFHIGYRACRLCCNSMDLAFSSYIYVSFCKPGRDYLVFQDISLPLDEYDHHLNPTSGPRFHADHANLHIGVVQIMTGHSSKYFCSSMVGGRNVVNEWIRKGTVDRRALLRDVVKRVALRRNVLDKYLGAMNLKLTGALGCA